jgi:hypothetical protein
VPEIIKRLQSETRKDEKRQQRIYRKSGSSFVIVDITSTVQQPPMANNMSPTTSGQLDMLKIEN